VNGFGIELSLRFPPRRGILPLLALATAGGVESKRELAAILPVPYRCQRDFAALRPVAKTAVRVGLTLKRWNLT
jgi:hypothetical protein